MILSWLEAIQPRLEVCDVLAHGLLPLLFAAAVVVLSGADPAVRICLLLEQQKGRCVLCAEVASHISALWRQRRQHINDVLLAVKHVIYKALGHCPQAQNVALVENAAVLAAVALFDVLGK